MVSPGTVKQITTHFEYLKSSSADRSVNHFLATYSYYTTLGANLGTSFGNGLQTSLTTIPSLPLGAVFSGISEFLGRIPQHVATTARNYRNAGRVGGKRLSNAARESFNVVYHELAEYKIEL